MGTPDQIAACIVAFQPDAVLLEQLARAARAEAGLVYIFINGGVGESLQTRLEDLGCTPIIAPYNLGVGEAFNICALAAILAGKKQFLLLDQDSELAPGTIAALRETFDALSAAGEEPAAVGPAIVSPPGETYKSPRYFRRAGRAVRAGAAPVQYVISSGSLISLEAFRRVGRFRSDFFIDAIDTEWCFRAWARGASCWTLPSVSMVHRIGTGVVRGAGRAIPRQSPMRLYTYVRNQTACLRMPHVPHSWKLRIAAHVIRVVFVNWLDSGRPAGFLHSMADAARAGWCNALGPPPGAQNAAALSS
ncbi:MAG: hypothetical protein QM759_15085 [Terricaulis sp.]